MSVTYRGGWLVVPLLAAASIGAAAAELPLIEAVKKADTTAVRAQLKRRADVNVAEPDGPQPYWAARRNDLDTAALLIRAGANVKAANRFGVTPLALASTTGSAAMIELLLKAGADPNSTSAEGEPALMTAALTGRVDVLQTLLSHGAKVDAKESWKGQTALMWAASEGHTAAVRALIKAGADINAREKGQFTPLLFAVREGHVDVVRALLEAGVNPAIRSEAVCEQMRFHWQRNRHDLGACPGGDERPLRTGRLAPGEGADANAPDARARSSTC
jgi:ankyrin repeat protein